MKYLIISCLILLLVIVLSSCSATNKIDTTVPEPTTATPIHYEAATSFIKLPVSIQLKDIEKQTNKLLHGLIYNDSILDDDNIKVKVWKQAPIKIESEKVGSKYKLKTTLPLKVHITYQYGFDKFGIQLYDTKEFNLNGVVEMLSDVHLTNWQIKSSSVLKSLDWVESPSVSIAGKNISITYLINPAIRIFKSDIEKSIDLAIEKSLDFKPQVLDALDKIATPFEISETYSTWFRIVPIELYVTEANLDSKELSMDMGLKCTMETIIGNEPAKKFEENKIVLKPVAKMPDKITANLIAVSSYEDASKIMTKNFQGQEFGDAKRNVKVNQVDLWHKNGKMIVALSVQGSVNGKIYLTGFPQFNTETREVYFDKMDYVLETKSVLMRSANWLAQGYVLRKIQESCRYSIQSNLDEGKQNVMTYLTNYSPMKGVYVNGSLSDFDFQKIELTEKAILAFIQTSGQMDIRIDGMD